MKLPEIIDSIDSKIRGLGKATCHSFSLETNKLQLVIVKVNKENFELDSQRGNTIVTHVEDHLDYFKTLFHSSSANDPRYFQYYLSEKKNRFLRYKQGLAKTPNFKDTRITLSFLDDGDLKENFSLYLLIDIKKDAVLYSCRVFSGMQDIKQEVSGGKRFADLETSDTSENRFNYVNEMEKRAVQYAETLDSSCVVFDRLSGKRVKSNPDLAKYSKYLLYKFFLKNEYNNGKRRLICLARQEVENRLVQGYVRLGMEIKGVTNYLIGNRYISHWLLAASIQEIIDHAEMTNEASFYIKSF